MFLIPQELIDAMEEDVVRPVHLIFIDWPGGAIYAHDQVGTLTYMNKAWLGLSSFMEIGEVENDSNIGSHNMSLQLSGIDPKALTEVVTNDVINRDVEAHIGALNDKGQLIAAAPYFYGRISATGLKRYGGDSITLTVADKTADWAKTRPNRYTDESYRAEHPGDDFLQYMAIIADRAIYWNSDKESTPLQPRIY